MSGSASPPPPAGGAAGVMPDPGADPGGDADGGNVVCTICSNGDGSYTVYPGDEPDSGGGGGDDTSEDDDDAMGGAGPAGGMAGGMGASAPQGQPADSIGAALKLVMTILQSDEGSQGGGPSPDDSFAAGFGGPQSGASASGGPAMSQKY